MQRHAPVLALAVAIAVVLLPRLLTVYADPDLWWHLYVGERILDTGTLPEVDDLSFTAAGDPWIDHEWGVEILMALAWRAAGPPGLTLLRIGLLLALTGGLTFLLWQRWRHPLGCALAVLVALPFVSMFINVRAHAFTYTLAVGVLVLLELARRRPVLLLALPLLMVLWVNLHGGFLLGLVLGLVGIAGLALGREGEGVRPPSGSWRPRSWAWGRRCGCTPTGWRCGTSC